MRKREKEGERGEGGEREERELSGGVRESEREGGKQQKVGSKKSCIEVAASTRWQGEDYDIG